MRRAALIGSAFLVMGIGARDTAFGVRLIIIGSLLLLGTFLVWRRGWSGSAGYVRRSWRRSRRHHGMASRWAILRTASRFAVRRQMRTLRPSYEALSFWQRLRVPTREFAYKLGRVGWFTVWATCEDAEAFLRRPAVG